MAKNKKYNHQLDQRMAKTPVENHRTAAWANIKRIKGKARVFKPAHFDVEQAKEYVDENEK